MRGSPGERLTGYDRMRRDGAEGSSVRASGSVLGDGAGASGSTAGSLERENDSL